MEGCPSYDKKGLLGQNKKKKESVEKGLANGRLTMETAEYARFGNFQKLMVYTEYEQFRSYTTTHLLVCVTKCAMENELVGDLLPVV